jgi:hypothetical protein
LCAGEQALVVSGLGVVVAVGIGRVEQLDPCGDRGRDDRGSTCAIAIRRCREPHTAQANHAGHYAVLAGVLPLTLGVKGTCAVARDLL